MLLLLVWSAFSAPLALAKTPVPPASSTPTLSLPGSPIRLIGEEPEEPARPSRKCTPWVKQSGITCTFGNTSAFAWNRKCDTACWGNWVGGGNWGPDCDREELCSPVNPDEFRGECGEWTRQSGVSCQNPKTGDWEQAWNRACKTGESELACSKETPAEY